MPPLPSHEPTGAITATPQGRECASAVNRPDDARDPDNVRPAELKAVTKRQEGSTEVASHIGNKHHATYSYKLYVGHGQLRNEANNRFIFKSIDFSRNARLAILTS
jgi:hypothetical protein